MSKWQVFIFVPIVVNALLAAFALYLGTKFANTAWLCYVMGVGSITAGVVTIGGFLTKTAKVRDTLISLVLHALIMILAFAAIHGGYGLAQHPSPVPLHTALYFSVVTWTTLGYGDFTPLEALRLLTASQAIAGYVFFGLIVGVTTNLISKL